METITSAANPLLKDIRKALRAGDATEAGLLIVEGPRLLAEARRSGLRIRCVITAEEGIALSSEREVRVPVSVFRSISGTETPQGVIALAEPPAFSPDLLFADPALILVLDGVQDPGNAGTIARAAEAFGATGMIFVKGSANPLHPKTLRASAGSLFRLPAITADSAVQVIERLAGQVQIFAAVPFAAGAKPIGAADLRKPCALVIGSEGSGVGRGFLAAAAVVTIPTIRVESLNAAMAATLLLYEAARQRAA